jgi:hypothetical protein
MATKKTAPKPRSKPSAAEIKELVSNETKRMEKRAKILSVLEPQGWTNCGLCSCDGFEIWVSRPGVCKKCNHNFLDHL